jgi:Fic family protein
MKKINYSNVNSIITPEIVAMLTLISEYKGKESTYKATKKNSLDKLTDIAKIQSIDSSNRIEGIYTTTDRLKALVLNNAKPKNRNEEEIIGYKEVLKIIHENFENISISSNYILQLHKLLLSHTSLTFGGKFKNVQNYIAEIDKDGNQNVLFTPPEPFETPIYIDDLCSEYNICSNKNDFIPLIAIPIFILDFLCVHPFNDGNGRLSRLLMLLLLYKNGYNVGKYISLERNIEKTKDSYYETLRISDMNWYEGKNDYLPFIKYFLGIIIASYRELDEQIENVKKTAKSDIVMHSIMNKLGKFNKKELLEEFPTISAITIERMLNKLYKEGKIEKHAHGLNTYYTVKF